MGRVHASAIVDSRAEIGSDVVVGPYAVVEEGAVLASECVLHAHAVVRSRAVLGRGTVVHPFAVVGGAPQTKGHDGRPGRVEIGEGNVIREHVTIHGGTEGSSTTIGAFNLLMVGAHVAHDVALGSHCVVSNAVQLAGHVVVEDWVTFGGMSGVAQRVRVGEGAFVAAAAACERDVPPFVVVQGDRARVRGVNTVGLRRRGVPETSIRALERAVHALRKTGAVRAEVLRTIEADDPYVARFVAALAAG